jgi:hypothetical protein
MNSILKFVWNLIFNLTGLDISFGAKYKDWDFFLIELPADHQSVKEILAERGLLPLKDAQGETRIQIVGCDMKDVEIVGSYYEISIQVPVEALDGSSNEQFTHLYLPVTTEAARWPGVDITGFPKFIAQINIDRKERKIHCRLGEEGAPILVFELDDFVGAEKSVIWEYYGIRKGKLIKTVFALEGKIFEGEASQNTNLILGEHPIADQLGKLLLSNKVMRIVIGHDVKGKLRKPVRV